MNYKLDGEFLKDLRSDKGLTQTQLAEDLGVSVRTIQNWELRGIPQNIYRMIRCIFYLSECLVERDAEEIENSRGVNLTYKEKHDLTNRNIKMFMLM